MKKKKDQIIFCVLNLILFTTLQTNAKLNTKWVMAEPDTVYLNKINAREYFVYKNIGEDLSNIGLLTSVAAIPLYYVSLAVAAYGTEREDERITFVTDVFSEGVLPLSAFVMAIGNICYSNATEKDPFLNSSITNSWLPYIVASASLISFSLLANRIYFTQCYHTSGTMEEFEKCDEVPHGGIVGVSALVTIPWMRYQFRNSKLKLDGIEIRPIGDSKKVSLIIGF
jgi:hypothetical protein